ncbi:MAG: hypothetical protein QS748_08890 [Candidatus Endonucleobacter bathymodioli]|uniref:HlyD family secretion protein n=1 Tax=Candidatus Endonucleibacter bathymodioli TaxID=539814 RepID=A0AA90NLL2_9GAMM|nr:hypothetical protein [Candidatus Endonucleobacter bathymodioli]
MNLEYLVKYLIKDMRWLQSRIVLPILVFCGVLILVIIVKLQPDMQHEPLPTLAMSVNYMEVTEHDVEAEIIGYGLIHPDISLQAKAEVAGLITYIHPKLKKGEFFTKDTLLLVIDDKDYQIQIKQDKADVLVNKANLQEMTLTIENNKLDVTLALEKLTVIKTEHKRMLTLSKTGVVSKSSLNTAKQNLLKQEQEVQQLNNKKTTLPSALDVIGAKLDISKAKLEKSERDLERTKIYMPFNGRISTVYTELNQYVTAGGSDAGQLFDAFSLNKMIINAQFPLKQFRRFARDFNLSSVFGDNEFFGMQQLLESLELTAIIKDPSQKFGIWQAKVERFSDNLDSKSRTVGIVVSVSDSYQSVKIGVKPPLLEGMYMKVVLAGKEKRVLVLPRFSLHGQQVYTINKKNQLQRKTLRDLQYHGELVLLEPSRRQVINAYDKIITSDVFPAINGMDVIPVMDESTNSKMKQWLNLPVIDSLNEKESVVEDEL